MTDLDELHRQIAQLSKFDRDALLSTFAEEPTRKHRRADFADEEIAVYESIERLIPVTPPMARFVEGYGPVKYAEKVAYLWAYLKTARKQLNQAKTKSLINQLVQYHIDDMKAQGQFLTVKNVVDSLEQVPYAVDKRFPGYAEAGFLHRIA
jgi:hypothetical protein